MEGGTCKTSASGNKFFNNRKSAEPMVDIALLKALKIVAITGASDVRKEAKYFVRGFGLDSVRVFLE